LRPGDAVLLQTRGNDFYDLARTRHGGGSDAWLQGSRDACSRVSRGGDALDLLRDHSFPDQAGGLQHAWASPSAPSNH
jgi:hypothetical protein